MRYLAVCILATIIGCSSNLDSDNPGDGNDDADKDGNKIVQPKVVQPDRPLTDTNDIAESCNQFALDLYHQLRTKEGNLFFSPSSISMAMAMTYAGAKGETEKEMAKTLHFEGFQERLHDRMYALQAYWISTNNKAGIKLSLANRLWGQDRFKFLDDFMQVTREKYAAELKRLDFAQPESARQTINQWVENQTNDKIKNLIPQGVIDSDTKLILTNAVYFHGTWTHQFKKRMTREGDFSINASKKVRVPLMNCSERFGHGTFEGVQVLEMPYGDESVSMLVLLPNEIEGLDVLESKLTQENLKRWCSNLRKREVSVTLPKFKTTTQFEMREVLESMGMVTAFVPSVADFSGMTGDRKLFIGAAVHKAFVDVNEEGTEAAAATGIVMKATSMPPEFRADHPFVFIIRDNRNGAILFMGRMVNPKL